MEKLEIKLSLIKNPRTFIDNHKNVYQGNLIGNYFQGLCLFYKWDGAFYYGIVEDNKPHEKGILKRGEKMYLGEFSLGQ